MCSVEMPTGCSGRKVAGRPSGSSSEHARPDRPGQSSRRCPRADGGRAARLPPAATPQSIAMDWPQPCRASRCRSNRGEAPLQSSSQAFPKAKICKVVSSRARAHRGRNRHGASYHGPERLTESNNEPGSFAASVNGRPDRLADGRFARPRPDAGQGLVRNQLGPGAGARRLLPGAGRRYLQETTGSTSPSCRAVRTTTTACS